MSNDNLTFPILSDDWPEADLEYVQFCPICGDGEREVLHANLVDNVFYSASGTWKQWRCLKCFSAYIDPRPSVKSIHRAYGTYYTHTKFVTKDDYVNLSFIRKIRRKLVNGYTNWRYGSHEEQFSILGSVIAFLLPIHRRIIDRQYRDLPKPPKEGGVLLDVGCGDGAFLSIARKCGWDVIGLDPDPKAVSNAKNQGMLVNIGGIEYYDGKSDLFDVITLSHVIEHVHEPLKVLRSCFDLLKPGGKLWLETPNINSFGHARFKENWRGLEAPRHLVLFNRNSLRQSMLDAGFTALLDSSQPSPCFWMYTTSAAIEQGVFPKKPIKLTVKLIAEIFKAILLSALLLDKREFLTMSAWKVKR